MAVYGTAVLTDQGMALYSKAQTGIQLNFSRMQIGSGKLAVGQDPTKLIALITPISNFAINSITSSGNTSAVKGVFENSGIAAPTYSCELGLFAQDPDVGEILYAYANAGDQGDTIPPISSGPLSKQYKINAAIGNAANVTATIPAGAYATVDQLDAHMADDAAHGSTSAATPTKIVRRDANGRFKAAAPAAADDVATKGTVDAAVSTIIGGAPLGLDTLVELASAIGNDPNFAATVTNSLAAKLNASAYTAADVLAKLLTVDGPGSTLDADTVDGIQAAAFALLAGAIFTGIVTAQNNTSYTTKQVRNITLSTVDPSGGSNGDVWIKYTP